MNSKRADTVEPVFVNGVRLRAQDGTVYIAAHVQPHALTLRREIPKVRGKAARREDKRARIAMRAAAARLTSIAIAGVEGARP